MSIAVVVNPVAGAGRMRQIWPAALDALRVRFGAIMVDETRGPGDASRFARKFAGQGASLVVAAGGDGTISEVADGLLQARAGGGAGADLGLLAVGTGSDLARGLGLSGGIEAAVERLACSPGRMIDAGRVLFRDDAGREASRHFINIASLGLSGPTVRAVNAVKQRGGASGKAIFLMHTVRELLRYRFQTVRITIDDQPTIEARIALVAVANGRYFGGGMMIAPDARLDDGRLDIVVLRAAGKLRLLADLRQVYSGAHITNPLCTFLSGKRVTVEPVGDAALIDLDGESPGRIPATFEVLPGALRLRC